ncbi:type II toxin-antitoxin system VapC family toxin [Sphingomonas sp. GB1N7]|uniref:type II toxin-antitoxin system VapC family toxin n=1 Tax=Parasphingomonas caseinilytica TaxID=3096158 RepID=UPI002FC7AA61
MRLLLDTHALAWWFEDSPRLGEAARRAIGDPEAIVLVSTVSAFEMATKYHLGKWPEAGTLLADLSGYLDTQRFETLPVSLRHAQIAGTLPIPHRDPFDRLLIAQAQIEQAQLVSNEVLFDRFGVRRLWD